MTKLYAQLLVAFIKLMTGVLGRWRKLTVRARVHDGLLPQSTVSVNGLSLTLLVPDRTAVYWPRHGLNSEPNTLAWIDGFNEEDIFFDIGANVGIYTLYAAKARKTKVVAIEPNPFSYRALVHNLHLNSVSGAVTPLCLAISGETAAMSLFLNGTAVGSVGNTIDEMDRPEASFEIQTLAFRLDDLLTLNGIPHPTQIKIDVDGIELPILKGAEKILADSRLQSVMVEVYTHDKGDQGEMESILAACGLTPAADWSNDGSDNRLFTRAR